MARGPALEVRGIRELSRTLRACGVGLEELKTANQKAAQTVARGATVRAPRASGALAGSIRGSRQANAAVVRAGSGRVVYAGVQNYGWPRRNISGKQFMERGLADTEPQWMGDYEREVAQLVGKVHGI